MLLESIAKSAELEASDAEIEARLEEMATSQGVDVKAMRDMANAQGWRPAIAGEIVDRKTMALIEESAQITEVEPSEDA